jgi:Transposase, Mutator family
MWGQLNSAPPYLCGQLPKVETMLRDAGPDITAFSDFPVAHCKKIWSTNLLERLNKDQAPHRRRRCFPTPPHFCAWPAPCSSKPTTNRRSPTNATSLEPPWPYSTVVATRGLICCGPDCDHGIAGNPTAPQRKPSALVSPVALFPGALVRRITRPRGQVPGHHSLRGQVAVPGRRRGSRSGPRCRQTRCRRMVPRTIA